MKSAKRRARLSLTTLAKAAEAMDCELAYAIRPKNKKYFSSIIWEILDLFRDVYTESCRHAMSGTMTTNLVIGSLEMTLKPQGLTTANDLTAHHAKAIATIMPLQKIFLEL